jgi:hypothetical protein
MKLLSKDAEAIILKFDGKQDAGAKIYEKSG